MKVFVVIGVSQIEDHWVIRTMTGVCASLAAAESLRDELTKQLPPDVNAEGVQHYWHDEEIYEYEIEECELRE